MKIFCDLDGTLLDVSPRHYKVYTELVEKYAGTPLSKDKYWDLKRRKTRWPELLPLSNISTDMLKPFLDDFIQRIEDPDYLKIDALFPGALRSLQELSTKNELYLVSLRRKPENLRTQLEWLGIDSYFQKILSGHSENDGYDVKINLIKQELGEDVGLIVGDTEADIVTGKELGLATVAVLSGIRDEQFLSELEPDYIKQAFSEIIDLPIFV